MLMSQNIRREGLLGMPIPGMNFRSTNFRGWLNDKYLANVFKLLIACFFGK